MKNMQKKKKGKKDIVFQFIYITVSLICFALCVSLHGAETIKPHSFYQASC